MSNHRDSGARQEQNPLSFLPAPYLSFFLAGGGLSISSAFGDSDKCRQNSGSFAAAKGKYTQFWLALFFKIFICCVVNKSSGWRLLSSAAVIPVKSVTLAGLAATSHRFLPFSSAFGHKTLQRSYFKTISSF